ncbi:MAG: alpha/beta fold hydrolase [Acetobacteraceae bacterium]
MPPTAAAAQIAAIARAGQRQTTRVGATRIVWRDWGAGPPLVLVHGDAGSWTHWVRNVLPLAQWFRVIAPDLPGYGESDALSEPVTPERLAQALADGVDALPGAPRTYRLAGFSFGGIIAGHLAAMAGARVERLVLLGAGGLGLPRPQEPKL